MVPFPFTPTQATLPPCLRVTARSTDGAVMALEHRSLPLHGVQFHPESVCTQHGLRMMANFVRAAQHSPGLLPSLGCALEKCKQGTT